jgi:hypothetical protein
MALIRETDFRHVRQALVSKTDFAKQALYAYRSAVTLPNLLASGADIALSPKYTAVDGPTVDSPVR